MPPRYEIKDIEVVDQLPQPIHVVYRGARQRIDWLTIAGWMFLFVVCAGFWTLVVLLGTTLI